MHNSLCLCSKPQIGPVASTFEIVLVSSQFLGYIFEDMSILPTLSNVNVKPNFSNINNFIKIFSIHIATSLLLV